MEDLLLYLGATLALRYARLGLFGRPERRLQQQVAELEVQLALVTARLHALEAAAGQDGPPTALLARDGGAAEAACAPAGLQRPRALSLGQGTGAAESPSCDPPTVKRRERDTTSAGGIRCKRSRLNSSDAASEGRAGSEVCMSEGLGARSAQAAAVPGTAAEGAAATAAPALTAQEPEVVAAAPLQNAEEGTSGVEQSIPPSASQWAAAEAVAYYACGLAGELIQQAPQDGDASGHSPSPAESPWAAPARLGDAGTAGGRAPAGLGLGLSVHSQLAAGQVAGASGGGGAALVTEGAAPAGSVPGSGAVPQAPASQATDAAADPQSSEKEVGACIDAVEDDELCSGSQRGGDAGSIPGPIGPVGLAGDAAAPGESCEGATSSGTRKRSAERGAEAAPAADGQVVGAPEQAQNPDHAALAAAAAGSGGSASQRPTKRRRFTEGTLESLVAWAWRTMCPAARCPTLEPGAAGATGSAAGGGAFAEELRLVPPDGTLDSGALGTPPPSSPVPSAGQGQHAQGFHDPAPVYSSLAGGERGKLSGSPSPEPRGRKRSEAELGSDWLFADMNEETYSVNAEPQAPATAHEQGLRTGEERRALGAGPVRESASGWHQKRSPRIRSATPVLEGGPRARALAAEERSVFSGSLSPQLSAGEHAADDAVDNADGGGMRSVSSELPAPAGAREAQGWGPPSGDERSLSSRSPSPEPRMEEASDQGGAAARGRARRVRTRSIRSASPEPHGDGGPRVRSLVPADGARGGSSALSCSRSSSPATPRSGSREPTSSAPLSAALPLSPDSFDPRRCSRSPEPRSRARSLSPLPALRSPAGAVRVRSRSPVIHSARSRTPTPYPASPLASPAGVSPLSELSRSLLVGMRAALDANGARAGGQGGRSSSCSPSPLPGQPRSPVSSGLERVDHAWAGDIQDGRSGMREHASRSASLASERSASPEQRAASVEGGDSGVGRHLLETAAAYFGGQDADVNSDPIEDPEHASWRSASPASPGQRGGRPLCRALDAAMGLSQAMRDAAGAAPRPPTLWRLLAEQAAAPAPWPGPGTGFHPAGGVAPPPRSGRTWWPRAVEVDMGGGGSSAPGMVEGSRIEAAHVGRRHTSGLEDAQEPAQRSWSRALEPDTVEEEPAAAQAASPPMRWHHRLFPKHGRSSAGEALGRHRRGGHVHKHGHHHGGHHGGHNGGHHGGAYRKRLRRLGRGGAASPPGSPQYSPRSPQYDVFQDPSPAQDTGAAAAAAAGGGPEGVVPGSQGGGAAVETLGLGMAPLLRDVVEFGVARGVQGGQGNRAAAATPLGLHGAPALSDVMGRSPGVSSSGAADGQRPGAVLARLWEATAALQAHPLQRSAKATSPAAGRAGPGGARRSRGPASGRKPASSQVRDGTICLSDE